MRASVDGLEEKRIDAEEGGKDDGREMRVTE